MAVLTYYISEEIFRGDLLAKVENVCDVRKPIWQKSPCM